MAVYNKPLINQRVSEKHRGVFQNNEMLNSFYHALSINELIQEAERLKINKQYSTSAQVLQIAQEKMYKNKEMRLELLLKYPMYLQLAGQEYTGWMEFLKIKQYFYGYQKDGTITLAELFYNESKITHVMALFQERKKEYGSAIYYFIRSYLESLSSLEQIIAQQNLKIEKANSLEEKKDLESIRIQAESYLNLKKAPFQYITLLANTLVRINCISALEEFNKLIQMTLLDLPSVDYLLIEEKVNEILIAYAV
ncbi:MAG: hypothetical protein FD141_1399 [Fusobacteria bacterium]|nr:MAG: hypothetical protein FD141_1399 [Fusobacteriota bacterium]KAF0230112.1 MAG: hypothetical protein FD182_502 [Fusobacteriota bacterium]